MLSKPTIFDCDGVLVDSEVIYLETERACLAEIGLVYEDDVYRDRFIGLTDVDYFATLRRDYAAQGLGSFPPDYGEVMDVRTAERMWTELQPVTGVAAHLEMLSGKLAVASSSNITSLFRKLRMTGLERFFGGHIYSGEQVAQGKPAPDLFLFAAARLGEAPQDCRVIEDSVNGVRAGCAAGMEVWGFAGGSHANAALPQRLLDAGASGVFQSFHQMSAHLSQTT